MVKYLHKNWINFLVMALGAVFILAGLLRGEGNTMFEKAINICLECIGIG